MLFATAFSDWWQLTLNPFQQVLFVIACATSVVFLIQLIMAIIGISVDSSMDLDTDVFEADSDIINDDAIAEITGLKLISFRTVMAFLCVFSWVTFAFMFVWEWYFSATIGLVLGAAVAVGVAYLIKAIFSIRESGNILISNAVGKIADVYLKIPEARTGSGKVTLVVQDSLIEREAVTDNLTAIKTGDKVRIVSALTANLLLVEPLASDLTKNQ